MCDKEEEEDTEADEEVRAEGKEEKWAVREGFTQRLMRGKQTCGRSVRVTMTPYEPSTATRQHW